MVISIQRFQISRARNLSGGVLLILFLLVSWAAADSILDKGPTRLEDILVIKQLPLDRRVEKTAIAIGDYKLAIENDRVPNLDMNVIKPGWEANCGESMFILDGFPNYRFVNEFTFGHVYKVIAVYEPDISDPSSVNHQVFDKVLDDKFANPKSWSQQMDDSFSKSLFTLIDNNNNLNSFENVDKAAAAITYIYYWHLRGSMYLFGECPEGIYTCNNLRLLENTTFGAALNLFWHYPVKRNDVHFNIFFVLPEGRKTYLLPGGDDPKPYQLTYYTWDPISRRILLWTFTGLDFRDCKPRPATENPMYINEIVIGYF